MSDHENRKTRIVIEAVTPQIDGGNFPIKRIVGDQVVVEADVFADGHNILSVVLLYRPEGKSSWIENPMEALGNDRWRGSFQVNRLDRYYYTIIAWIDRFKTWQQSITKKVRVKEDISVDLLEGIRLIEGASNSADETDAVSMRKWIESLGSIRKSLSVKAKLVLSKEVQQVMYKYSDRQSAFTYPKQLAVVVDREKARFSTWYEMFPRSCTTDASRHGTFRNCEARLPYIAEMGFDVIYFPPIHPIGSTSRKGNNNIPQARPGDPGTPWAIGSAEGGHKATHPQLGTTEEFKRFIRKAESYGIEIALDLAFQCSPDHPYVTQHPEWFRWRPDGTVQYAENPPKKYQDIYPLEFQTRHWEELWEELKSIVLFWIEQGIRIFRVDNPHTKPFAFWEWLIDNVKRKYPDALFLSEAFTRPKIMYHLAKLGFSQSYTYFTWRNVKWELTQYFTELTQTDVREYFHPTLWPNTPDILSDYLRDGGRAAFVTRLVLAATLGANYGIYGPAYELCVNCRKDTVSEEYLNSEKYEIKYWDINHPDSLKDIISRVNRIRRKNQALQNDWSLRFHPIDNEQLICYSKSTADLSNVILTIVNLDFRYKQSGLVNLNLAELGLESNQTYHVHDMLNETTYQWQGGHNYVELDPERLAAHILKIQ